MNNIINKKIEKAHNEWIAALDAIEYPIFMHDREFRVLRCNLAYQQHAGRPFKEIIGRPYYELFPKNDGPMHHCLEALEHPTEKGSEEEVQVDSRFFFSRGVIIKDDEGNYLYSLHILKDITEQRHIEQALRESEEKFRSLVESTSDWIWEVNTEGLFTYVSPRVTELLGYTQKEILGTSPFDLMPFDEAEQMREIFQELLQTQVPIKALQNVNLCKDGTLITLETSGVPFFDADGVLAGYRGIDRDITKRIL
ncbi:MAG TPA: PAS domain S-box protein, partial [Sulfuricurvum sp.]|nr:PAS domain S-box protein [Sulfuricurvum sp.]